MSHPFIIFITGFPGTGKTRLGRELSDRLKVPYIAKDAFKERMFDTLGYSDKAWSRKVSAAAHRIIDYILEEELSAGRSLILESNFKPDVDNDRFKAFQEKYKFVSVQILCWGDGQVLFERFVKRQNSPERHPGFVEEISLEQLRADFAPGRSEVLSMPDKTIEIDTTDFSTVNYDEIAAQVRRALAD